MCGPRTLEVRLRPDLALGLGVSSWTHLEIATLARQAEILAGWEDGRRMAEEAEAAADGFEEVLGATEALNRALELSEDVGEVIRELASARIIYTGFPSLKEAVAAALRVPAEAIADIRLMWRVSADVPEVARLLATDGDWGEAGEVYVPEALEAELRSLPAEFELTGLGADLFPAAPSTGQRIQYVVRHGGAEWGGWIREARDGRLSVPVMVDPLGYRRWSKGWMPVSQGPRLPGGLQRAIATAAWCLLEMGVGTERRAREAELLRLLGL